MAAKILIINEICNYFMLTLLKDRVIKVCFVIKDRVIKACFTIKDRVINPIFYSISSILLRLLHRATIFLKDILQLSACKEILVNK